MSGDVVKVPSGSKLGLGFSRAVRVGQSVYVAGTTATGEDGTIVGKGDAYAQAIQCFKNVEKALHEAGVLAGESVLHAVVELVRLGLPGGEDRVEVLEG
jgi:enamine deaminase RidA (YjgF/YER057c/UK114 family)